MKRIFYLLFFVLLGTVQLCSQIKTNNSREDCSVRGIKFGYIYTVNQLKEVFGEPLRINCFPAIDYGNNYELYYTDGFTLRMNDDAREGDPGILCIIIDSDKYVLDFKGITLKVGDPFEKVKQLPGYTCMEERSEGFYAIFFDNNMHDESLWIIPSEDGKIEMLNVEPRYY